MRQSRRTKGPEQLELEAYLKWFGFMHPDVLIYKINNEGKRNPRTAKASGIVAGMPDLHIVRAIYPYHSLYIEMKRADGKGRLSEAQRCVITLLRQEGHYVVICEGWEEAAKDTMEYFHGSR